MPDLLKVSVATAAVLMTAVVAACGDSPTTGSTRASSPTSKPPSSCTSTGPPISLGYPGGSSPPALFTSDGSELVFAADGFPHGGVLDPKVGITAVYVGNPDRMPVFSQGRGAYSNVTHEFQITEGQETTQTLPAGRYWLVNSNFRHMTVRSCPPGGVTLLPSGRNTPSPTTQTPGTSPPAPTSRSRTPWGSPKR